MIIYNKSTRSFAKRIEKVAKVRRSDLSNATDWNLKAMAGHSDKEYKYITQAQVELIKRYNNRVNGIKRINIFMLFGQEKKDANREPIKKSQSPMKKKTPSNSYGIYYRELYNGQPIDDWKYTDNPGLVNRIKAQEDHHNGYEISSVDPEPFSKHK